VHDDIATIDKALLSMNGSIGGLFLLDKGYLDNRNIWRIGELRGEQKGWQILCESAPNRAKKEVADTVSAMQKVSGKSDD